MPPDNSPSDSTVNRRIRVFVSSTFRDMMGERDELMTHTWPELRRFCRERQVELVEVDLRWGIAEEQSTRKETLKLCLDEIRACRPFFIGLLGERYGWVPGDDAFTADLLEEQPWLVNLRDRSVTELEIVHGVLREEQMHGRAFFYFRDPAYLDQVPSAQRSDFVSETPEARTRLEQLKASVRHARDEDVCHVRENYPNPRRLAELVLEDLKAVVDAQFPIASIPNPLDREARDHEAFAEIRRRTYIGRIDYFTALDRHAAGDGAPLVVLGDSGSGKSSLLANWLALWRQGHPHDFIFQHYIGGIPDSAEHWRLMTRLIAEIKRWIADPEELPRTHDDLLKTFPVWLVKARLKAERDGVRCLVVVDALNQLDDRDHARLLGWLPVHPFTGALRLIVSTLPGDPLTVVEQRRWESLRVEPLTPDERRRMIADYLARFGKKLDAPRLERLAAAPAAANPLYLKILLDELRVTGTHDRLDERLGDYLAAPDIPALLRNVLARYQRDYEHDRPGLVSEALGLIWATRRGLTETELLRLLRPADLPQQPLATWAPLRAALEEGLVDRGGILNFAHDFLRAAVATAFVPDQDRQDDLRIQLADYFEPEPVTARSCDELPWLLWNAELFTRLRACLLDIDRFLLIHERDQEELMRYWVGLNVERTMGKQYLTSFATWLAAPSREKERVASAANQLTYFLIAAGLYAEAEPLMRRALAIDEQSFGLEHPYVARDLNNLAQSLERTNRLAEAEPLLQRALAINEQSFGPEHPIVAVTISNLATLYYDTDRLAEAEPLLRRALAINEQSFGPEHPNVAMNLNNLAHLLQDTNRLVEAEPLLRRALAINEQSFGPEHPTVAIILNALAGSLKETNRLVEAEPLLRRALAINEQSFGPEHPIVAAAINNLVLLLLDTNRLAEAEPLLRRAISIFVKSLGENHPSVSTSLNNLAQLLQATNRLAEAEPLTRRALAIDEQGFGPEHPKVAMHLNNLARLLQATNRLTEAEPLMRRHLAIFLKFTIATGQQHPHLQDAISNYAALLQQMGRSPQEVLAQLNAVGQPFGIQFGG
ncbi:MAG: tetratricopeptide repeat protein [Verrucomicrobiia bacterium]